MIPSSLTVVNDSVEGPRVTNLMQVPVKGLALGFHEQVTTCYDAFIHSIPLSWAHSRASTATDTTALMPSLGPRMG